MLLIRIQNDLQPFPETTIKSSTNVFNVVYAEAIHKGKTLTLFSLTLKCSALIKDNKRFLNFSREKAFIFIFFVKLPVNFLVKRVNIFTSLRNLILFRLQRCFPKPLSMTASNMFHKESEKMNWGRRCEVRA